MDVVTESKIKQGMRIRWTFPSFGISGDEKINVLRHFGYSKHFDSPSVDFIDTEGKHRTVPFCFITHLNGRRTDQSSYRNEHPENFKPAYERPVSEKLQLTQLSLGLTEEDWLMAGTNTKTRKSLDEMSESHRQHIEKWEPHIKALGCEHVWAHATRVPGRGAEGPVYVAVKRGSKDYAILDYDTSKPKQKANVIADGFETSTALMEAFKEYREMAKNEKAEARAAEKPAKGPRSPKSADTKATAPRAAKAASKPAAKTAAKKPARKVIKKS